MQPRWLRGLATVTLAGGVSVARVTETPGTLADALSGIAKTMAATTVNTPAMLLLRHAEALARDADTPTDATSASGLHWLGSRR